MGLESAWASPSSSTSLSSALLGLIGQWRSDTRLYSLSSPAASQPLPADLMAESFVLNEVVSETFTLHLQALVLDTHVQIKQLLARPITLNATLADGSRARRSGDAVEAQALEADGGLARTGLVIRPWIALLDHSLSSPLWQDKSLIDIVEDVFAAHRSIAAWRWDADVPAHIQQGLFARNGGQRSVCAQCRETDFAFVQRLLAAEGVAWRVQEDDLHSTQAQTWLQMGHLLHQADNHRGSFRGLGFELRTDAWGGLRAVRGVMLSTFGLAKQMQQLAQTFHEAAGTHQTVGLAAAAGSCKAIASALDDQAAPAAALDKSLSGMVSRSSLPNALADAADKATTMGTDKVPHMADPNIALVGKAGLGLTAGQDLHISAQDTATLAAGQDQHWAVGGAARLHTGQAIGILAGAIQPGSEAAGKGLTVIAAQGGIDMQAQAGPAQVASKQALELKTAQGVVNIAAAKKVVLAVSGGASITIEGGSFTAQRPGKISVMAGQKSMLGGGKQSVSMPGMPKSVCVECLKRSLASAAAFTALG